MQQEKLVFYDIESLENIFTLSAWYPDQNLVNVWFRDDSGIMDILAKETATYPTGEIMNYLSVRDAIYENNENFNGRIQFLDLRYHLPNHMLFQLLGTGLPHIYPPEYNLASDVLLQSRNLPVTYLLGYNSANYDMSEYALYVYDTLYRWLRKEPNPTMVPQSAKIMQEYSNDMFTEQFKSFMPGRLASEKNLRTGQFSKPDYNSIPWQIRKALLASGRHIDVSCLNEKQKRVGLKRLCGMLGLQILESETLDDGRVNTVADVLDLISYNVSDVINLEKLFHNRPYFTSFELKKGILDSYPELIYEKRPDAYAPNINPNPKYIRKDRLCADSTSAKLCAMALCPYGKLKDKPVVSFNYPSPDIAEKIGIQPYNVLELMRTTFYNLYPGEQYRGIQEEFDVIYRYYKSIEGKNFNGSESYFNDYNINGVLPNPVQKISDLEEDINTNLFYYGPHGEKTSCFVTFSIGGIHGQEVNTQLFDYHMYLHLEGQKELAYVKSIYPNPLDAKKAKKIIMPDGTEYKTAKFLTTDSTLTKAEYREVLFPKPEYFKKSKSTTENGKSKWKLNKKYAYTSAILTNHEDFSSYYPGLLINKESFKNPGLGYDRYSEIYDKKETLGSQMKDERLPKTERDNLTNKRTGTKLILNAATGGADAKFESAIRMNNEIIAMRCIGQMFSWIVGQTQAHAGAVVPSTNTDGLYTVMEATKNNQLLAQVSKDINIRIDPEPVILISKDTNNRMEIGIHGKKKGAVLDAKGSSLSCWQKPELEQSLSHPAILDYALVKYLPWAMENNMLDQPADKQKMGEIIRNYPEDNWMLMFQNVVASSTGTNRYVYASVKQPDGTRKPKKLQHYNRVYYVKEETKDTVWLQIASAKTITPAEKKKRKREGLPLICNQPEATYILQQNGVSIDEINQQGKNATTVNIPGIKGCNEEKPTECLILNKNLEFLPQEQKDWLRENLDYDYYIDLCAKTYTDNWKNEMPPKDWDPTKSTLNPAPVKPVTPVMPIAPTPAAPVIQAPTQTQAPMRNINSESPSNDMDNLNTMSIMERIRKRLES